MKFWTDGKDVATLDIITEEGVGVVGVYGSRKKAKNGDAPKRIVIIGDGDPDVIVAVTKDTELKAARQALRDKGKLKGYDTLSDMIGASLGAEWSKMSDDDELPNPLLAFRK